MSGPMTSSRIAPAMVASTGCDEFTHECLAIRVARKFKTIDVIDVLSDLFILRGHSRSPRRLHRREAQIVIESWRRNYNTIRPTPQSDTSYQHQRCSCPHSPRGRLRYAD